MRTDEALRTYHSLSSRIFSKDNKKRMVNNETFKATTLETEVQKIVRDKGLGELMLGKPDNSTKGNAFVCAAPAKNMSSMRRFRNI